MQCWTGGGVNLLCKEKEIWKLTLMEMLGSCQRLSGKGKEQKTSWILWAVVVLSVGDWYILSLYIWRIDCIFKCWIGYFISWIH